jgi:hypothetical protein
VAAAALALASAHNLSAAEALASVHSLSAAGQKGMAGSEVEVPRAGMAQVEAAFLDAVGTVLAAAGHVFEGRTQLPQVDGAAARHGDSVD